MKKLLVIEDDPFFSAGLVRALSRRNYVCKIADDLTVAHELCISFKPEYILLDLNLAGVNTQDHIPKLRQLAPHAALVVLTGNGSVPSTVQAMRSGADHYLCKPASLDVIEQALQSREVLPGPQNSLWGMENAQIARVLSECGGNVSEAARRLGLHRRTLQRRMKKI